MRRAIDLQPKNHWPTDQAKASVTLAFDVRHKRRIRMTDDDGHPFLLDLPEAMVLGDGDGLVLETGGFITVKAAAEPVADIAAATPADLARLAWHVGNRHEPLQVIDDLRFRVRDDHVLLDMLNGLGARVLRHVAPFAPERGAYSHGGHGNHNHGGHDHAHNHDH